MKTSISHRNRSAFLATAIALLSLTAVLTGQAAPTSISQAPDTTRIEDAPLMSDSLPCVRDSLQAPSEQELAAQLAQVNAPLTGKWLYDEPSVDAKGTGFVSKLGKPIAKSKLKKGLKKAYNKLKLKKRWTSLTLTAGDGYVFAQNCSGYLYGKSCSIAVSADGKSVSLRRQIEPPVWSPIIMKHPLTDPPIEVGELASYVSSATFATSSQWFFVSPDGSETLTVYFW